MSDRLEIGQVLYGYCGGYFGRDSYDNKRVEALGHDWVVVRPLSMEAPAEQIPDFYNGDLSKLLEYTVKPAGEEA